MADVRRGVCVVLMLAILSNAAGAQPPAPPLAQGLVEDDLGTMIRLRVPDAVIVDKIATAGVAFPVDEKSLLRLQTLGASDVVLAAVRQTAGVGVPPPGATNLTYADVLRLLNLQVDQRFILKRLQESPTRFTLTAAQTEELRRHGAAAELIAALQAPPMVPPPAVAASPPGPPPAKVVPSSRALRDLVVILDSSAGMLQATPEGPIKLDVAKGMLADLIQRLPPDVSLSLIVMGNDATTSCEAVKVLRPLGPMTPGTSAELLKVVASLTPAGQAPLSLALETARRELARDTAPAGVVVLTSVAETCRGLPASVAAAMANDPRVGFGIQVVGFAALPADRPMLEALAAAGKGRFHNALSAAEFTTAVVALENRIALAAAGQPARPASGFALAAEVERDGTFLHTAPMVQPGEYKGHLAMMEAQYYQVPLHKGQQLFAVGVVQKSPYQAIRGMDFQTFSVTIYGDDFTVLSRRQVDVQGNPSAPSTVQANWTATRDGTAYVAIAASGNHSGTGDPASVLDEPNIRPSPYALRIRLEGEPAVSVLPVRPVPRLAVNPGKTFETAGELVLPGMTASPLGVGDIAYYQMQVLQGSPIQVVAAFKKPFFNAYNGSIQATYTLRIFDADHLLAAEKRLDVRGNPPDAHSIVLDWTPAVNGLAYISLTSENSGQPVFPAEYLPLPAPSIVQVARPRSIEVAARPAAVPAKPVPVVPVVPVVPERPRR